MATRKIIEMWAFPVSCALACAGLYVAFIRLGIVEYSGLFGAGSTGLNVALLHRQKTYAGLTMKKRSWHLNCGMRPGYGNAAEFTYEEAFAASTRWMQERVDKGLPILAIIFRRGDSFIYPVRNGENKGRITSEGALTLDGELSPAYDKDRTDEEVLATLKDLAYYIGRALNQTRVYITYMEVEHIIEIK